VSNPTLILQTYHYETKVRGRRGAYRRTGEIHSISDETVRRYVHQAEAPSNALAYTPPPGGYPTPEPLPQIATEASPETPQAAPEPPCGLAVACVIPSSGVASELPQHHTDRFVVAIRRASAPSRGEHLLAWIANHDAASKQVLAYTVLACLLRIAFG